METRGIVRIFNMLNKGRAQKIKVMEMQLDLFEGVILTQEQEQMIKDFIANKEKNATRAFEENRLVQSMLVNAGFVQGEDFKNTFKSTQGRKTFAYLLCRLKTFSSKLENAGDIALHNLGIELLQLMNPNRENEVIENFVNSIMDLEDLPNIIKE